MSIFHNTFRYGGVDFSRYFTVEEIKRPPISVDNTFIERKAYVNRFIRNKADGKHITVKFRYIHPKDAPYSRDQFLQGVVRDDTHFPGIAAALCTGGLETLYLGDRWDESQLFDICVVDGEVSREDFAYTSLFSVDFYSPFPYSLGPAVMENVSNLTQVYNPGNVDVFPYVMVPKQEANPFMIGNVTLNGETLIYDNSSSIGMRLLIDNSQLEVYIGGNVQLIGSNWTEKLIGINGYPIIQNKQKASRYLTLESQWLKLVPGNNQLTCNQTATVAFNPLYLG